MDLHEGVCAAHLGMDKTLARLKERFYWPGHYNDVENWCRNCAKCVMRKTPAPKARAPLQSIKASYPMQIVPTDILGPFPESTNGNNYKFYTQTSTVLPLQSLPPRSQCNPTHTMY